MLSILCRTRVTRLMAHAHGLQLETLAMGVCTLPENCTTSFGTGAKPSYTSEDVKTTRDNQLLLNTRELFLQQNKDIFNQFSSPDKLKFEPGTKSPSPEQLNNHHVTHFSASNDNTSSSNEKEAKGEGLPDLDKVADALVYELTHMFVRNANWKLYHPKIVFDDRISTGKRYEGLLAYVKFIHMVKALAHIRFVYVRFHILYLNKHPEDGTIGIRWQMTGLGVTRLAVRYIPDKLWQRGSMDKAAKIWYDGYSTFHVDSDNLVVKHVADTRMPDKEKESSGGLNPVVEKLKKLKPNPPAPSPAM